mgnify:CR=1 FL=1
MVIVLDWLFSCIFSYKALVALLVICCLGVLQTSFLLKGSRLMIEGGVPDNQGVQTLLTLKRAHQVSNYDRVLVLHFIRLQYVLLITSYNFFNNIIANEFKNCGIQAFKVLFTSPCSYLIQIDLYRGRQLITLSQIRQC